MPSDPNTAVYPVGWLRGAIERAQRTVASWPQWEQDYYRAALAQPEPDPCTRKRACDEAQTCVGGCAYGNRH
jgi:hypothetical protein